MKLRATILATVFVITMALGQVSPAASEAGEGRLATLFGGSWTLTDSKGQAVTDRSWLGKVVVLYFGYRSCPDICPTGLQTIAESLDYLGHEAAERVQPLFVSLDPERDTADKLAEFTAQFHARLIGLTGTPEQIAAIAKAYRVSYRKVPAASGNTYFIDHSAMVYLIGPDGKTVAVLGHETSAETLAAAIGKALSTPTHASTTERNPL